MISNRKKVVVAALCCLALIFGSVPAMSAIAKAAPAGNSLEALDDGSTVFAASYEKMTRIKQGVTTKVDLNGGKKERVKIIKKKLSEKQKSKHSSYYLYKLKIGNKIVKTVYDWDGEEVKFFIVDINKKDKYKEIVWCSYHTDVSDNWWYISRYNGGKLVSIKATYALPEWVEQDNSFTNVKYVIGGGGGAKSERTFRFYSDGTFSTVIITDFDWDNNSTPITKRIKYKVDKNFKLTRLD
jgi:hypothetical protein